MNKFVGLMKTRTKRIKFTESYLQTHHLKVVGYTIRIITNFSLFL